ncbi:MAG TPA: hypothetical protein VNY80_12525 [Steroidobacteraceae bacterium]|nr:hypothetical protein [Steroidobacteraceae bacterium]
MQNMRLRKLGILAIILGLGALASSRVSAADVSVTNEGVNMWDGQWHFESTMYAWVPWMYTTVQLPPIAGGGSQTIDTQPSQYLKYVELGGFFDGTIRKGDWSLWTDLVYMNLQASSFSTRQIGLPGGNITLPVIRTIDSGLRAAIWTLAPTYTVMNNDIGTLDVLVGLRYTSVRVSLAYQFTAPPTALMQGGGFWPTADSTDGLIGIKGSLRLSSDGRWYLPYEADFGDGNKNRQYNAMLGVGYHFHWGDISLAARNLTYELSDRPILDKIRMTGPVLGATFRW